MHSLNQEEASVQLMESGSNNDAGERGEERMRLSLDSWNVRQSLRDLLSAFEVAAGG